MKVITLASVILLATASMSLASEFCDGFEEGYKTIKGNNVYIPYCPYEPYTPYGSTPFQEGLKAGMKKAAG
jgi:hypothetical protein